MTSDKLRPLSDFEWASVSQYIVYISGAAQLEEINSNHVISFPLSKIGPGKIISRKGRVLAQLEANSKRLEGFVGKYEGGLDDAEMAVLRSLYLQYKRNIETVNEHLRVARLYQEARDTGFFPVDEGVEDDLPF